MSAVREQYVGLIDINRTPVSKTRPLSSYQLTHDVCMYVWSEPSVRRILTSVSIVCTVVAEQTDPRCTLSSTDTTHKGDSV